MGQLAAGTRTKPVGETETFVPAGRLDELRLPGGWLQDYRFDAAGQLIGIDYRHEGVAAGELGYAYGGGGLPERVTGSWARVMLPESFGPAVYDAANRPVTVDGISHAHDADGNLTHDGVRDYSYDVRGQLAGLAADGHSASFVYDGLGRRQAANIDADIRQYLHDGHNPVQELEADALPTANLLTGGLDSFYSRATVAGTFVRISRRSRAMCEQRRLGTAAPWCDRVRLPYRGATRSRRGRYRCGARHTYLCGFGGDGHHCPLQR